MTSDDEATTPSSKSIGKKKPKTGKRTPVEPQCNNNEDVTKKKPKKKALAQEDAISSHEPETIEMVPKKEKKKKVPAEDTASCDYKSNDAAKKKKKNNVLNKEITSCDANANYDANTNYDAKKKNISDEDTASLDCKSNDVPKQKKKKNLSDEDNTICDSKTNVVPKRKKKKNVLEYNKSCDPKTNDVSKMKRKKKVLDNEIVLCDPKTDDDVPKKKKKNDFHEDIVSRDVNTNGDRPKKKKKKVFDEEIEPCEPKANVHLRTKKKKTVLEEDNTVRLPKCKSETAGENSQAPSLPKSKIVNKKKKNGTESSLASSDNPKKDRINSRNKNTTGTLTVVEKNKIKTTKKVLDNEIVPCDPKTDDVSKKKKKNDFHEDIVSCDVNTNGDRPKKKKKKVFDEEIEPCEPKANVHLRTKKKKTVLEEDNPVRLPKCKSETAGENSQAPSLPKSKIVNKKKKNGTESSLSSSDNPKEDRINSRNKNTAGTLTVVEKNKIKITQSNSSIDNKSYSKPKKNKKKNSQPDKGDSGDETTVNGNAVTEDLKVKKKKKDRYDSVLKDSESSAKKSPPELSEIVELKKRGKASSLNLEDADIDKHSVYLSELSKNPGKDVSCPRKTDGVNSKQKKKRKAASPDEHLVSSNISKMRDGEYYEDLNGNCGGEDTDIVLKKKIKKGKEKSLNAASLKEANSDVQLVSEKAGNTDELHIDTVRRKALQEDIDRESGNTKGSAFGQWATASFQTSDQQTKFFRLLGGFKKGNQITPPSTSSQEKANMALGKEGAQTLERNLQVEFDKALTWKQNRGIGLGCQPAQKKAFYIDKTISKSVKFED
ncbi:lysine-rich nucleolar protein 1 [Pseudophryne corroboree]|uniref:lysine-rich nucleolar protein 1 n=1 Tax=Pseudophryne corroboree TaxID=495146 RepID=UPI00308156DE